MILHYDRLIKWAKENVKPFDLNCVNPSSIDLRIDKEILQLGKEKQRYIFQNIPIIPGAFYLASTIEYITMPDNVAGLVCLKSSLARQGLDHSLAGWVDSGFEGQLTLELHSHFPVKITAGQRIVQLVLMETTGNAHYKGRYQYQEGITEARE
jgi:dCTP deaminase